MRNLLLLRQYAPVIFDATHSVQIPNTGGTTGGNSSFVPYMARAAASVGVDGFFFETHIDPKQQKVMDQICFILNNFIKLWMRFLLLKRLFFLF